MKPSVPEFSRPLDVARVPKTGSREKIAADPGECEALAKRLGVPALHSLSADLTASPWRGGGLKLEGTVKADIEQVSVISLEPFRHDVAFAVLRYFLPEGAETLGEEADADPILVGHVDLGEVAAETLALELDPYPRQPGESFAEKPDIAAESQETASPFAALSKLRPK